MAKKLNIGRLFYVGVSIAVLVVGVLGWLWIEPKIPYFRVPVYSEIKVEKVSQVFPEIKKEKVRLKAGEVLRNDTLSPMVLKLKKIKGKAVLMPGAEMALPTTSKQRNEKATLSLLRGKATFKVKRLGWKQSFSVKTPTAVAGVRGTAFVMEVDREFRTSVSVPEGSVAVKRRQDEKEILVGEGFKTLVHDKSDFKAAKMSPEEMERERRRFESEQALKALTKKFAAELNQTWPDSAKNFHLFDGESAMLSLDSRKDVEDISILSGFPLTYFTARATAIRELSALRDKELTYLNLHKVKVKNISALAGMPLLELHLEESWVDDLSPLQGMRLKKLSLGGTAVKDLTPLKDMPLQHLSLWGTQVKSLAGVEGMPLTWLSLSGSQVKDLKPLQYMKDLVTLAINNTAVSDLEPIRKLKLEQILLTPASMRGSWRKVLKEMKSIKVIATNNLEFKYQQNPNAFWKNLEAGDYD